MRRVGPLFVIEKQCRASVLGVVEKDWLCRMFYVVYMDTVPSGDKIQYTKRTVVRSRDDNRCQPEAVQMRCKGFTDDVSFHPSKARKLQATNAWKVLEEIVYNGKR